MEKKNECIPTNQINNDLYNKLGERWYHAQDDPVALLRAERKLIVPWLISTLKNYFENKTCRILDVGCGAGLVSNPLSQAGHHVSGLDLSIESLKIAKLYDLSNKVNYIRANAYQIPFPDHSFDVVCSMDFLEHVDSPGQVVREISRVLKPNGLFLFNTFNRNFISWLIAIKGVEWFVKNTPENLHIIQLFIKPIEITQICKDNFLIIQKLFGIRPNFFNSGFLKLLISRTVPDNFEFIFTSSLKIGYGGYAIKQSSE